MSSYSSKLEELISQQNGTVLSSDLKKYGIPRTYLSMMVKDGALERVGRGIYALPEAMEDEMYAMQSKYKKLIFSHETALYIHGLSDRTPMEYSASVPSGYKVVKGISERFKIYYIRKDLHQLGIAEMKTPFDNPIRVYSVERTICDLLRSRNRIDDQIFNDALKRFAAEKAADFRLLLEYAKAMRVDSLLKHYLEVLL